MFPSILTFDFDLSLGLFRLLILKTFELVILNLWGHLLSSDSLQFGYKAKTSTIHCTWLVSEVVQHMLRGGINPILTVLDCSKAFDKCKFSILFNRLLDKGLPPIVVRIIVFIYTEQFCWVKWGDSKSSFFKVTNGTRQGAILSPFFWAVYADPLISRLRSLGVGVHIGGLFMGCVLYADDLLLIAPSRSAMQRMLEEINAFAKEVNITFSSDEDPNKSKSKCIFVIGKKANITKPAPLMLGDHQLPFVSKAEHLGNILSESGDMELDASSKRAKFIQSAVETRELFKWAPPEEIIWATKVYSSSFYGSELWDLGGGKANQVYKSWNTAVKLAWGCPQQTRTYILQNMLSCGFSSARVDILSKFVSFFKSLRYSASKEVQVLSRLVSRDVRSCTGKNLLLLQELSGLSPWTVSSTRLKQVLMEKEQCQVPIEDQWRLPYLESLISQRRAAQDLALDDLGNYITELINSLIIS